MACRRSQIKLLAIFLTLGQTFAFICPSSFSPEARAFKQQTPCKPELRMAAKEKGSADKMKRVQLGKSDLKVSEICLGTMTWGQQNTEKEAHEQMDIAFDEYGINFLDTAELYPVPAMMETQGRTDTYIGRWLQGRKREDVVLATKVAGYSEPLKYMRSGESTRLTEKQILYSVDASLERLQTDYIDLLQLHWPDRYVNLWGQEPYLYNEGDREAVPFEETLRALEKVVKAGKVRYIGLSNETPYGLCNFLELSEKYDLPRVQTIQNCYNLMNRNEFDSGLLEVCRPQNADVSLLAYSPLAGGALTGKYTNDLSAPDNARLNLFPGYMSRYKGAACKAAVLEYMTVAEKYNVPVSQIALGWCYSRPHVASTIIGATSVTQLRENIEAYHIEWTEEMEDVVYEVYSRFREPARGAVKV